MQQPHSFWLMRARGDWRQGTLLWSFCLFLMMVPSLMAAEDAKKIVALVDYIGGDYKNAVRAGKVVNPEEHQEMVEFSRRSLELLQQLKTAEGDKAGVEPELKELVSRIRQKEDERRVSELAKRIKEKMIAAYGIVPHPRALPSLQAGKALYMQNCAQCHGNEGKGDGPSRGDMQPPSPPPANFMDPELMAGLSPFKAFNAITFGIERTAMPSFAALAEDERWQAAFYIFSLRFTPEAATEGKKLLEIKRLPDEIRSVATLAVVTDQESQERLQRHPLSPEEQRKAMAYLRRGVLEDQPQDPLIVARTLLGESIALHEQGEKEKSYQKAVEAYLDGFELTEAALRAKDASLARRLESQWTQFRNALKSGDEKKKIQRLYQEIDGGLVQASQLLSQESQVAKGYVLFNAALIILREGLEAAFVLAAILTMLKVMGATQAIPYIHLGWGLALLAGLLTWVLAQTVVTLSGSQRESLEGFATLMAAAVLFYMGYWLHTKSEARKWQQYIHDKVQAAFSSRRILALVGVSFFAVYREAFEVVLFYQALWLQSHNAQDAVIWGFVVGLAILAFLVFLLFRLGLKIPLKYFFGATGILLFLLAFVFAGQGVQALQVSGWLSVTPLRFVPQVSFLGMYPTLETLLAQAFMLAALFGALFRPTLQRHRAK